MKKSVCYFGASLLLFLSACNGEEAAPEEEPPTEEPEEEPVEDPAEEEDEPEEVEDEAEVDPIVHTHVISDGEEEYEVELTFQPIERFDEFAVLSVDLAVLEGEAGGSDLQQYLSYPLTSSNGPGGFDQLGYQIRLIDPAQFTASHTLFYQEDEDRLETYPIRTDTTMDILSLSEGEDAITYQAVFNAPVEDAVHALVGNIGFIENIPVIDSEDGQSVAEELLPEEVDVSLSDLAEQVYPLQTYNENFTTPVGTLTEEDQATITLASDILFDFDSADLHEDATEVIQATGDELSRVDGGDLVIVGHTDNQGDESYNQTLSEERAESVLNQLEELVDLSHFDSIETEGQAFHEPVASNDNEEGQALNRRVELHFTPPAEQIEVVEEVSEFPESEGPVIDFSEEDMLEVEVEGESYGITVDSLRRVDGFIIGQLEVHNPEDGSFPGLLVNSGLYSGARRIDRQEAGGSSYDADGITLLYGEQRIFPIDYWALTARGSWELGDEELYPLADRSVDWFADSEVLPVTIVWPDVPTDSVTLDIGPTDEYDQAENLIGSILGTVAWRIENVPVEDSNGEASPEANEEPDETDEEDDEEEEE